MSSPFDVLTSTTFEILKKDLPDPRRISREVAVNSLARDIFLALIRPYENGDAVDTPDEIRDLAQWCKDAAIIFYDETSK